MRRIVLVAAFAALPAVFAGESWRDKDPAQWSAAETGQLLADSPWARVVTAEFNPDLMRTGMDAGSQGRRGWGGGGRGGGDWGGGAGGPAGGGGNWGGRGGGGRDLDPRQGLPQAKFTVRWASAGPLLEAARKSELAGAEKLAAWAKEYYVVTVTDLRVQPPRPVGGQGQWGNSGRGQWGDAGAQDKWTERMLKATSLKRKGRPAVNPVRFESLDTPAGRVRVFLFSRSELITDSDHALNFETAFGPIQIKAKFALKDMHWRGQLAL